MILLFTYCFPMIFSAQMPRLHKAVDDAKAFYEFSKKKLQAKPSTFESNYKYQKNDDSFQYYFKSCKFHDFNDKAIEFIGKYQAYFTFFSECSFFKVNPYKSSVLYFETNSFTMLYRCCTRECSSKDHEYGIFMFGSLIMNRIDINASTIATCKSQSSYPMIYFKRSTSTSKKIFNLKQDNFSDNHAVQKTCFYIFNMDGTVEHCTFEKNKAYRSSIIYHDKGVFKYDSVIFIKNDIKQSADNPAILKGWTAELKNVFFIENNKKDYEGSVTGGRKDKNTPKLSHLSILGCEAENDFDGRPKRSPFRTPISSPQSTPSSTPPTTPSITHQNTPSTTPSSTPQSTPSSTPITTPRNTPSTTPSLTPSRTPDQTPDMNSPIEYTQMPNVYFMQRKHYLIGGDA